MSSENIFAQIGLNLLGAVGEVNRSNARIGVVLARLSNRQVSTQPTTMNTQSARSPPPADRLKYKTAL